MDDDLILRLRDAAKMSEALAVLLPHSEGNATAKLYNDAADAIEELSSQLDDFKRLCLPLKENRLYKYSDGSFVEVFLILPSEPTKEET